MEDEKIVALYWARDERAVTESALRYGSYCRSIAFRILGQAEDTEECVNDTWLAAWNAMPPHRPAVLSVFLGKITRRLAMKKWRWYDAARRGSGETAAALDELAECIPSPDTVESAIEAAELVRTLDRFLDALQETERRIFVCRYWYLLPVAEIAGRFGFTQSKVKSMLSRTRIKLRIRLEEEGVII